MSRVQPTDITDPEFFHQVVDCQWACPAHTPVPEYIRLIKQGKYTESYLINWVSNVFPGILGRTCDRPCEPACRRTRTHEKPVAICRLKRVAFDNKGDIDRHIPSAPVEKNGKRIALVGAGPASLAVARDLVPLGYHCEVFEQESEGGGFMRSQIPAFRLPVEVLEEEVARIVDMGVVTHYNHRVESLQSLTEQGFDAVFVGSGAPRGRDLPIEGRNEASNIHIGIDWLNSVAFGHTKVIGKRVLIIGGGNTAMDCCRTSLRLGGSDVQVLVRSGREAMKASPWEIEDAEREGIPILNNHVPHRIVHENGKLKGMEFLRFSVDENGNKISQDTEDKPFFVPCDDIILAIGQQNAFPWIEKDIGIEFDEWEVPVVDEETMQSTKENIFFGGDAAFGPKNIIWAVAHAHQAAISIDKYCRGESLSDRPAPGVSLVSQKMGIHEWSYENEIHNTVRQYVPHVDNSIALKDISLEVELGYDHQLAHTEADRCLNCDVQTVFVDNLCIECDACVDICPVDCINFLDAPEQEADLREALRIPALNEEQPLYVSGPLKTQRIMAKDEDMCLHCGLCAERCPTNAWDMQKFLYTVTHVSTTVNQEHNQEQNNAA